MKKKPFSKETPSYKAAAPVTPYQKAKQEWDDRIGNAVVQAKNWRFVAILSLIVTAILLVMLIISLLMNQTSVFVAQVTKGGQVVNVAPLERTYEPTEAQKEYFISRFIELVREVPLDPVVAKKNWTSAYRFLTQRASAQLNTLFQKNNPVKLLGKETVTVKVTDVNPVSQNTYQVNWIETTVDSSGENKTQKTFSGVFTLMIKQPTTEQAILRNPLGVYITDFHISSRETNS